MIYHDLKVIAFMDPIYMNDEIKLFGSIYGIF